MKKLSRLMAAFAVCCLGTYSYAQDNCSGLAGGSTCATAVAIPSSSVGVNASGQVTLIRSNNSNGNPALTPTCWADATTTGQADRSVWFSFTVPTAGDWTISFDNGINDYDTDTQAGLYDACGSLIGCSDDAGDCNVLAAGITGNLNTTTTYYLQVDVYGTTATSIAEFAFTITKDEVASNDCITTALSLDALYTPFGTSGFASGGQYIYNPYSYGTGNYEPSSTEVVGGGSTGCNGGTVFDDVWFTLSYDGDLGTTISVYPTNGCNYYGMQVFRGTPDALSNCDSVQSGLTLYDCSAPDGFVDLANNYGGSRNWACGDFFDHPRVDLSGITSAETIYIRVYQLTDALESTLPTVRSEGLFSVVFERKGSGDNSCNAIALNSCIGNDTITLSGSNAGMRGGLNAAEGSVCNPSGRANEPSRYNVANGTTWTDWGCTDELFLTGGMSLFNNNSVYYTFQVEDSVINVDIDGIDTMLTVVVNDSIFWDVTGVSNPEVSAVIALCTGITVGVTEVSVDDPTTGNPLHNTGTILNPTTIPTGICPTTIASVCGADVKFCFNNLDYAGVNGATAEFYVVPVDECNQPTGTPTAVFGTFPDSYCDECLCFGPSSFYLPSGRYALVVDGDNGSLASYNLTASIGYFIPGTILACDYACVPDTDLKKKQDKRAMNTLSNFDYGVRPKYLAPTPAQNYVDFGYVTTVDGTVKYAITDVTGKIVEHGSFEAVKGENKQRFNTESLTDGMYIMTFQINGVQTQIKMMKEGNK